MTRGRLPVEPQYELALHRAEASRRRRAARREWIEERLRALMGRAAGDRTEEACCA